MYDTLRYLKNNLGVSKLQVYGSSCLTTLSIRPPPASSPPRLSMNKKSPSGISFLFALLAASLLLGVVQRRCPTTLCGASTPPPRTPATTPEDGNEVAIGFRPIKKLGGGLGRIVDWGLSKIDNAVHGGVRVSDLIAAFAEKCDAVLSAMVASVVEMSMPYERLRDAERGRLARFDADFKNLVEMRNRIERRCLRAGAPEDRSACVDGGVEVRERILDLRGRRAKSADAIVRYDGMIQWCASYNNWFC